MWWWKTILTVCNVPIAMIGSNQLSFWYVLESSVVTHCNGYAVCSSIRSKVARLDRVKAPRKRVILVCLLGGYALQVLSFVYLEASSRGKLPAWVRTPLSIADNS